MKKTKKRAMAAIGRYLELKGCEVLEEGWSHGDDTAGSTSARRLYRPRLRAGLAPPPSMTRCKGGGAFYSCE